MKFIHCFCVYRKFLPWPTASNMLDSIVWTQFLCDVDWCWYWSSDNSAIQCSKKKPDACKCNDPLLIFWEIHRISWMIITKMKVQQRLATNLSSISLEVDSSGYVWGVKPDADIRIHISYILVTSPQPETIALVNLIQCQTPGSK